MLLGLLIFFFFNSVYNLENMSINFFPHQAESDVMLLDIFLIWRGWWGI